MKTWQVTLTRVEYQSATIEVEAETAEDAEEVATEEVASDDYQCMNADEHVERVEEIIPS